jgi:hypothetical protein
VDDVGLTRSGVVAGTPEYMAPEQARGEPVDHRADLFSLGAVLYACCTGGPPFRDETPLAVLRRVGDEAVPPVRTLNPAVPPWLEAFVARLVARDPGGRFDSAAEAAALLERYGAHLRQPALVAAPELPASAGTLDTRGRREPPRTIRRTWLLALAGLAGVIGVFGAVAAGLPRAGREGEPPGQAVGQAAVQPEPPRPAAPAPEYRPAGRRAGQVPPEPPRPAAPSPAPGAAPDEKVRKELERAVAAAQAPREALDAPPAATAPTGRKGWLTAAAVAFGLLFTMALAAGWYARSRRRPGRMPTAPGGAEEPTPDTGAPSVAVSCPACGKRLRARADLAGKKAKCPACGQPVPVPVPGATPAPGPTRPAWRFRAAVGAAILLTVAVAAALCLAPRRDRPPADILEQPLDLGQPLGLEPTPGIEEQGLFAPEVPSGSGEPRRWTDGSAKLVLPVSDPPPRALAVRLWIPGERPVHVGIKVNGEPLCSEQAPPSCDWLRTFDLTGRGLGKAMAVEILSTTFVPADQNPGTGDFRKLGVCFQGITLFRSLKAYVNVPLGIRPVPGVGEEGFHYPEKGSQEYRWTNGSARLFVPIRGKHPRALALSLAVPDRQGYRVKVVVNGQALRDEAVAPRSDWSAELPLDAVNLGDEARIELVTSSYVPARVTPGSTDQRELGVRVTRLMLVE